MEWWWDSFGDNFSPHAVHSDGLLANGDHSQFTRSRHNLRTHNRGISGKSIEGGGRFLKDRGFSRSISTIFSHICFCVADFHGQFQIFFRKGGIVRIPDPLLATSLTSTHKLMAYPFSFT
jgi:hypothetical protein